MTSTATAPAVTTEQPGPALYYDDGDTLREVLQTHESCGVQLVDDEGVAIEAVITRVDYADDAERLLSVTVDVVNDDDEFLYTRTLPVTEIRSITIY